MPHAENGVNQSTMTNGETPSSTFIDHLTSYPVVSDGIETYKTNKYGAKSIEIADGAYSRFGKPFLPYLRTPYSFAHPYVKKADSLANNGLDKVETQFPIVKEDTHTVVDTAKGYIFWPLSLADQGYGYLIHTWTDEYDKTVSHGNRGPGLTSSIMAIVSTEMKVSSDVLQAVADWLAPKKEKAKQKSGAFFDQAQKGKDAYFNQAKQTASTYSSKAQEKAQEKTN